MKRKVLIILAIVAAIIALALTMYFLFRPTLYKAESIDPRTLHASPAYHEILVGLWQKDGHVYYRFDADGSGRTWDVDDDVSESEASAFGWEAYEEAIMMTHKMRIRGIVPRYYELDHIGASDLRFHDSYSTYVLVRVDEAVALEDVE